MSCIFCRIIKKEIPSACVYEDEHCFAFLDINPLSNGHVLVMAKTHCEKYHELSEDNVTHLAIAISKVSKAIAKFSPDYNIIQNNGELAGQAVKHVHFHIIPKKEGEGLVYQWKSLAEKEDLQRVAEKFKALM